MEISATVNLNENLVTALKTAAESQKTGVFVCESEEAKRLIFLENGLIVGAKSELESERLGEIMVAEGRITEAQLGKAVRFIRSGRKLGQGGEIEKFVRIQIIRIACACLSDRPKRALFSERMPVEALTLAPVLVTDVLLEAAQRLPSVDCYREHVLTDNFTLALTLDAAVGQADGVNLTPEQAFVLDQVNGDRTASDILKLRPELEDDTLRILVGLLQAGLIELERKITAPRELSEPAGARPADDDGEFAEFERELARVYSEMQLQNHWQVLGLNRGATTDEVHKAYQTLMARFHPDQHARVDDFDFQEKLSMVVTRFAEAYETLSNDTSSVAYDELVDKEEKYEEKKADWDIPSKDEIPEEYTRTKDPGLAKQAFQEGDYWTVIKLCRSAIEHGDNEPHYFHLLGRALAENPRWRKDAEQNLKIAINLKPWEPRYQLSLGQLYEKGGLHERAQRIYEPVRTMDPDFPIPESDAKDGSDSKKKKAG